MCCSAKYYPGDTHRQILLRLLTCQIYGTRGRDTGNDLGPESSRLKACWDASPWPCVVVLGFRLQGLHCRCPRTWLFRRHLQAHPALRWSSAGKAVFPPVMLPSVRPSIWWDRGVLELISPWQAVSWGCCPCSFVPTTPMDGPSRRCFSRLKIRSAWHR